MDELDPNILTPNTYERVYGAFHQAILGVLEEPPTRPWVNVLCAQWGFETLEGRACHDHNLWNLRGRWRGHGTTFKSGEIDDAGREVILQPGDPANVFRAYPGDDEAARDCVRFIFTQSRPDRPNRYAAAADAAREGDVIGYVRNLRGPNKDGSWTINGERLGGFFTAVPHVYLAGCQHLFWKYQSTPAPPGYDEQTGDLPEPFV